MDTVGCIPHSGGCERPATDALVEHLNWLEGTQYEHRECLDIAHRDSPQPECLYVEIGSGRSLVIERKTISWPADYIRDHKNDHLVADHIYRALKGVTFDDLYVLRLPYLLNGARADLSVFAQAVAEQVRASLPLLGDGISLGAPLGNRGWSLCRQPLDERDERAPTCGMIIAYDLEWEGSLDPSSLPPRLVTALTKIYMACNNKFAKHSASRRILLLDPQGTLRFRWPRWWNAVFQAYVPPCSIEEVWSGIHDWITEDEEGWMIDSLFPCPPEDPEQFPIRDKRKQRT